MILGWTMKGVTMEKLKLLGIPAINGGVLALTTMEHIDVFLRMSQVILVLCTIVFTVYQIRRLQVRLKNEKQLRGIIADAQHECDKAQHNDCPLKKKMDTMEREKVA